MGGGLFALGVILLLILLVVGILIIVYKDRIFPSNPNFGIFLGVFIIVIASLLLIYLFISYYKKPKVKTCIVEAPVTPEKIQFQTNKPVMITISPVEVPRPIEAPKPFEIIKVNSVSQPVSQIQVQQPVSQIQVQQQIPQYQQSPMLANCVTPVTIRPVPIPETIIGTI